MVFVRKESSYMSGSTMLSLLLKEKAMPMFATETIS